MFKTIIFDIDGTLTRDIAWVYLTKKVGGSVEYNDTIFASWDKGEITELEARKKLIENWSGKGKGFKPNWQEILMEIALREDAEETITYLKNKGYKLCIITGSFDVYAEVIGEKLGITDRYANAKTVWDNDKKLVDVGMTLNDKSRKTEFLKEYCANNNFQINECVPIGDSGNDIGLFEMTGNGIAVKTEFEARELENIAWKKIEHLRQLKDIL